MTAAAQLALVLTIRAGVSRAPKHPAPERNPR